MLMMQSSGIVAKQTLEAISNHPNDKVRKIGRLYRQVRCEIPEAKARMKFLFGSSNDWVLCDQMALLFSMAHSEEIEILDEVVDRCLSAAKISPRLDLRITLSKIASVASVQLSNVMKGKPPAKPVLKLVS